MFLKLEIRNHYYRQLKKKYYSILDNLSYWCEKFPKLDTISFLSVSMLEENPKILAAIIAMIVGIFTRNIIATIFSGLASYWFLIFVV